MEGVLCFGGNGGCAAADGCFAYYRPSPMISKTIGHLTWICLQQSAGEEEGEDVIFLKFEYRMPKFETNSKFE
jgi:hypothetical protein